MVGVSFNSSIFFCSCGGVGGLLGGGVTIVDTLVYANTVTTTTNAITTTTATVTATATSTSSLTNDKVLQPLLLPPLNYYYQN